MDSKQKAREAAPMTTVLGSSGSPGEVVSFTSGLTVWVQAVETNSLFKHIWEKFWLSL